jgi:predicted GNAT family acetyltransferase
MNDSVHTQLDFEDKDAVQRFLQQEPLDNLYLFHALERRGTASGGFHVALHQGQLAALLCVDDPARPSVGYLAANPTNTCVSALAQLGKLAAENGPRVLMGKRRYVESAITGLELRAEPELLHFYRADPDRLERYCEYPIRVATRDDIPRMVELYRGYEYSRQNRDDGEIEHEIRTAMEESGVYFVLEQENRIVSAARIYPETSLAGLIGAARTLPEFRGQRMYLSVRTACFEHLFQQQKTGLGLVMHTNTNMHRVLEKQGGTILDDWCIARLRSKNKARRRSRASRIWSRIQARLPSWASRSTI